MSTPVALASCHVFSIIMQVCLAYNVILNFLTVIVVSNIISSVFEKTKVIPESPGVNPGCFSWFPLIMQVCFVCNVILMKMNCCDCRSCSIHDGKCLHINQGYSQGPDVNPGCPGWFLNSFNNYANLLGLQCNIKCFNCHNCFLHHGKCLQVDRGYS